MMRGGLPVALAWPESKKFIRKVRRPAAKCTCVPAVSTQGLCAGGAGQVKRAVDASTVCRAIDLVEQHYTRSVLGGTAPLGTALLGLPAHARHAPRKATSSKGAGGGESGAGGSVTETGGSQAI